MKRILQVLAVILVLVTIITWATHGAGHGWTKTETQIKTLDPVTGIDGITYENKFQPGVDFLGAGLLTAGVLAGISLLFRAKSNPTHQH